MRRVPMARVRVPARHGCVAAAVYRESADVRCTRRGRTRSRSPTAAPARYARTARDARYRPEGLRMWKPGEEESCIGYAPPMPPRLGRFVRRVVIGIGCFVVIVAVTLASGHLRLEGGTYEFGHPKSFSGTIVQRPYPALRLDGVDSIVEPWPLLVAPGKHGADALVRGLEGRHLSLTGTRIQRGAHTMIEVEPASLPSNVSEAASVQAPVLLGQSDKAAVELTGEIVDSKCFLGVMVPGSGKTHKECASLCLRGGIPPEIGRASCRERV